VVSFGQEKPSNGDASPCGTKLRNWGKWRSISVDQETTSIWSFVRNALQGMTHWSPILIAFESLLFLNVKRADEFLISNFHWNWRVFGGPQVGLYLLYNRKKLYNAIANNYAHLLFVKAKYKVLVLYDSYSDHEIFYPVRFFSGV
jgi:hypothetical protein